MNLSERDNRFAKTTWFQVVKYLLVTLLPLAKQNHWGCALVLILSPSTPPVKSNFSVVALTFLRGAEFGSIECTHFSCWMTKHHVGYSGISDGILTHASQLKGRDVSSISPSPEALNLLRIVQVVFWCDNWQPAGQLKYLLDRGASCNAQIMI